MNIEGEVLAGGRCLSSAVQRLALRGACVALYGQEQESGRGWYCPIPVTPLERLLEASEGIYQTRS
jgi:hypothetical protein